MKKYILPCLILFSILYTACIKDDPLNSEADILTISFPQGILRNNIEIYNDYVYLYPRRSVDVRNATFSLSVTEGATWEKLENPQTDSDTLFYIKTLSENKRYTKTYSIVQISDTIFPETFDFETWNTVNASYRYENPVEGPLQWYSSNNGIATAWNDRNKLPEEYPARKTNICVTGNYAVELSTMVGPGSIAGGIKYIPCVAGSLYLGGFDIFTGLTNPLKSTKFGVPFNEGKPVKLTGYYMYMEGTEDFINSDGSRDALKRDMCAIHATLFKTDKNVEYLYGDNISTSDHIIGRAEIKPEEVIQGNVFVPFELIFDYDSYSVPFSFEELENSQYKISIVFASSNRGAYYEGRPGSRLLIDNVRLHYEK